MIQGGSDQGMRELDVKGCGAIGGAARGHREELRIFFKFKINRDYSRCEKFRFCLLVGRLEICLCSSFPPGVNNIAMAATAKSLDSTKCNMGLRGSLNFLLEQELTVLCLHVRNADGARRTEKRGCSSVGGIKNGKLKGNG